MTTLAPRPETIAPPSIAAIDHVEWWVGSARHAASFFQHAFGFSIIAYGGPETGMSDRTAYVVEQGDIRWVLVSPLTPDGEISEHVRRHGDGVRSIAFSVTDVPAACAALEARGAVVARAPWVDSDGAGQVSRAEIGAYGDTVHALVDRSEYGHAFAPGFEAYTLAETGTGLTSIDHVVANVGRGEMDAWVDWYRRVFDFGELTSFDESQISTQHSALRSTVVWNGDSVKLPINEPADGLRASQIDEYLEYYGGPGVQHLALSTDDIVATMTELRRRGVRFLDVPASYYEAARHRMRGIDLPWSSLADLGVLVDRDEGGYLLQVFTETVTSRPTVFLEIIQRVGATGFGEGNFKALFEAIEREQARRGNL